MFDFINQFSGTLSLQLQELAYGYQHIPVVFAFFLGLIGAVAPCQLTSNISAITIYGNRSLVDKVPWLHVFTFILGKLVVFTVIGIIIWLLGRDVQSTLTEMFPILRKAIGPMLILTGLFMLGAFRLGKTWKLFELPFNKLKDSYTGSFLMGVSFTVAFCPTMFILFIATLMPIVLETPNGFILPSVFGIGTSFPLLIVIFLIWYFGASGIVIKKSRKIGAWIQKVAGALLLLIGILDTLTFW